MTTKENITFQRGMLKSIQTRVTTLASILFFLFDFAPHPFCRLPVQMQTWPEREPNFSASLRPKAGSNAITIHLFSFPASAAPMMHFPCCCILITASTGKPLLNYFPSPHFPTPQIVFPPSTTSSRKSICARGGTLSFWAGWLASAWFFFCSTLCTDALFILIVTSTTKSIVITVLV